MTRSLVQAIPAFPSHLANDRLRHVRRVARLMDSEFEIPRTNFRFGLDPLLGLLLPGVGSVASSIVSLALVATMLRHGASRSVVVRMLINILIDTTLGSVPIIGNIFDFAYRANDRNVELLLRHYEEGRYHGNARGLIAFLLLCIVGVCGLICYIIWLVAAWALHATGVAF